MVTRIEEETDRRQRGDHQHGQASVAHPAIGDDECKRDAERYRTGEHEAEETIRLANTISVGVCLTDQPASNQTETRK